MGLAAVLGRLVVVAAVMFAAMPLHAAGLPTEHPVVARLVSENASVTPGQTLWFDLHLDIAPGWHTYWRNPGDSGLPTEIAWKLPDGCTAGEIAWPVPGPYVVGTPAHYD